MVLKVSLIFVLLARNHLDENINVVECVSYISHKWWDLSWTKYWEIKYLCVSSEEFKCYGTIMTIKNCIHVMKIRFSLGNTCSSSFRILKCVTKHSCACVILLSDKVISFLSSVKYFCFRRLVRWFAASRTQVCRSDFVLHHFSTWRIAPSTNLASSSVAGKCTKASLSHSAKV